MSRAKTQAISARVRLATNLRELRQAKGVSQEALGELAGLHRTYVSQVERAVNNVSLDNLDRLATALEVDIAELLAQRPRRSANHEA